MRGSASVLYCRLRPYQVMQGYNASYGAGFSVQYDKHMHGRLDEPVADLLYGLIRIA